LLLAGIEPQLHNRPARSLAGIPTKLCFKFFNPPVEKYNRVLMSKDFAARVFSEVNKENRENKIFARVTNNLLKCVFHIAIEVPCVTTLYGFAFILGGM
jgi:hypothetical protein